MDGGTVNRHIRRVFHAQRPLPDVAAAIGSLDLLIGVDTALVHLAGAMGRPVWTMISKVPDWRWMLDRTDSPWYPSMRLFRQSQAGDWSAPVDAAAAALADLTKSRKPKRTADSD
jgi:ADP-heptose:LPS heptosyltransferase